MSTRLQFEHLVDARDRTWISEWATVTGGGTEPLCAAARLSLGGLACVQVRMFGARSKAAWVVKHLPVDHDLVSELRFSGLDPVRRL